MSTRTVLVDGDMVVFKGCIAVEKDIRWDEFNHVLTSNIEEAWSAVSTIINGIARDLEVDNKNLAVAFSGGDNFRKKLSDTYKRHRGRKPLCYSVIRERVVETFSSKSVEGLEGDDLLGIWQTSGKLRETVIWSGDKDMRTVPGKLFRDGKLFEISEQEADYWWMTQTLTGDTTDGYSGLSGCGPKTAEKILGEIGQPLEDLWKKVVEAYEKKGLSVDDALLQARLARILRSSDWDSQKKEVKLWQPN
jgi:DNA polymerase-1